MTLAERSLWAEPLTPPQPSLQQRFEEWLRTSHGQAVYAECRDRAFALRDAGVRHYGIAAIFESARFDRRLRLGKDEDGFRLNHNHRSRLARRLMADYPSLDGMFETRELRS